MKIRALLSSATAALVMLSAAACGGASAEKKEAGADGLIKVQLDSLAVANVAFLVAAKDEGIFEKHGIDLEIKFVEPPALVPSVMSGDADVIWNNPPALLAARSNNVPIKSITTVSIAGDDPGTFPLQVVVPKGSDIKSLDDLEGKTVATASLFQVPDLALMAALEQAGIDRKSVKFVEVPFPNMGEALSAGRADAVISTEPFMSIMKAQGAAVPLLSVSEGLAPTSPISALASSEKFISTNPDLVDDFRAAVDEASEYAVDHEDKVRALIPTFTELSAELAQTILLAPIDTTDDPDAWEAWAELLVNVGVLDKKPDSTDAFLAD